MFLFLFHVFPAKQKNNCHAVQLRRTKRFRSKPAQSLFCEQSLAKKRDCAGAIRKSTCKNIKKFNKINILHIFFLRWECAGQEVILAGLRVQSCLAFQLPFQPALWAVHHRKSLAELIRLID